MDVVLLFKYCIFDTLENLLAMNIECTFGKFKIIKTLANKDELLILSQWDCLVKVFENSRIFLVNKKDAIFGVYTQQNEFLETLSKLIQQIDYRDWDHLHLGADQFFEKHNS